jgi:hypothetical protein
MIRDALTTAIPLRAFSTRDAAVKRTLIPTVGLTQRAPASGTCAIAATVALATIAGSTDESLRAATGTEKAAHRFRHRRSSDNRRAHRHSEKCRAMLRTRSYLHRRAGHGIGFTCKVWADAVPFSSVVNAPLCTVGIEQPWRLDSRNAPDGCGSRESPDSPLPQRCCYERK